MSQQVISQDATLDDIIFKDKNREFGAFLLRTTYPKVIKRSVILGSSLFVGALLLAAFWKQITADNKDKTEIIAETMKIDQPPPQKKVELPPPPPPPPPKEIPKVTTTKFLPPEIKHDEEVQKPEPPPEEVKGNTANETVKGVDESYEAPVDPMLKEMRLQLSLLLLKKKKSLQLLNKMPNSQVESLVLLVICKET